MFWMKAAIRQQESGNGAHIKGQQELFIKCNIILLLVTMLMIMIRGANTAGVGVLIVALTLMDKTQGDRDITFFLNAWGQ